MPVNLIKLAVGAESVDHIRTYQAARMAALGLDATVPVYTRRSPRRVEELLGGGSLYWVIRGALCVRQRVLDLQTGTDAEGRAHCEIWLNPRLVATRPVPWRPFQGWRYLATADAPSDLPDDLQGAGAEEQGMPAGLASALDALGVR